MLKTKIVAALALATAGLAQAQVPSSIVLLPFCLRFAVALYTGIDSMTRKDAPPH